VLPKSASAKSVGEVYSELPYFQLLLSCFFLPFWLFVLFFSSSCFFSFVLSRGGRRRVFRPEYVLCTIDGEGDGDYRRLMPYWLHWQLGPSPRTSVVRNSSFSKKDQLPDPHATPITTQTLTPHFSTSTSISPPPYMAVIVFKKYFGVKKRTTLLLSLKKHTLGSERPRPRTRRQRHH
jgi:hypothetical protein